MGNKRVCTVEFKREAVLLSIESDLRVAKITQDLGIPAQNLYQWRSKYFESGQIAFLDKGNRTLTEEEKEISRLKQETSIWIQERHFLKKNNIQMNVKIVYKINT